MNTVLSAAHWRAERARGARHRGAVRDAQEINETAANTEKASSFLMCSTPREDRHAGKGVADRSENGLQDRYGVSEVCRNRSDSRLLRPTPGFISRVGRRAARCSAIRNDDDGGAGDGVVEDVCLQIEQGIGPRCEHVQSARRAASTMRTSQISRSAPAHPRNRDPLESGGWRPRPHLDPCRLPSRGRGLSRRPSSCRPSVVARAARPSTPTCPHIPTRPFRPPARRHHPAGPRQPPSSPPLHEPRPIPP